MLLCCRYFARYGLRDQTRPHHCRFIDAALGEGDLRVDCADLVDAPAA
jgi:hypothetical protein